MELKFTIKIKDEKNPPIFKEELGKGVLQTIIVKFKDATEDDFENNPTFINGVYEMMNGFKEDWIEVKCEKYSEHTENKISNISDVVEKYCVTKNGEDYYFDFDEDAYIDFQKNNKTSFYRFRITIYNKDEVYLWYRDIKLHTFNDKNKLEQFFKTLL